MRPKQLIQLGRREPAESAIEHNWTQLDPFKTKFDRQTILIFGGNTTDNPAVANGYAKNIERLLSKKDRENVDILAFSYQSEFIHSPSMLIDKDYIEYVEQLYHTTFEPILYNEQGRMKEKQGIEKAFQNLIFVGHCGGCSFINLIFEGFYQSLLKKYQPLTAEMLMSKLQYIAYAPYEFPFYETNSLLISPFADPSYSWANMLDYILSQKIDNDFPKGLSKELQKRKNSESPGCFLDEKFQNYRSLVFKKGGSFYLIPGQMNPSGPLGDHSIECFTSPKFLEADCDPAETAKVTNSIARLMLKNFISRNPVNHRKLFEKFTETIYDNPPNKLSEKY